jgi:flagellar basal body P-ring formation protein FlgA
MKARYIAFVAALTFTASGAFAAAMPKAESVIMHDKITLGDVFDGVTENADYYLAPAPSMGRSMTLDKADLMRISDTLHLGWNGNDGPQRTVIRRSSTRIDQYDVQAALQQKMKEDMKGQKFEMEMVDKSIGFSVPETEDKSVTVESINYDAAKGTFKAVVSAEAQPNVKKTVAGRFYQVVKVPVVHDALRPGDVISAADIDHIDMRMTDVSTNMVMDERKLIGQTPRRGLNAMKPIMAGDIMAPVVVKKGDLVTMTFKRGMINLTAQGKALDNGAEGAAIRIMNTSSKQVVDAVVTGAQTVSIKTPENTL